ncbi:MAG: DUF429 domain-containing protein [Chloroflexi bacterium]|nr:MAG: DUF429 domain-containing protein [Chloroflexota bacterium]MBL1197101.1 DUF429 domain-containing protein [Chloroflexota bacterium]NOH14396.1 DUF429 domain-containing protein [Chloroflexota bacterium]
MDISQHYFIGIEPDAGLRRMAYAALDEDLRPMALGIGDFEEVLAYVGGQKQATVAIAGPPRPNLGLMAEEERRSSLEPMPAKGTWKDCRLAEYLLYTRDVQAFVTPAKTSACKAWMRSAFHLYEKLFELGYVNHSKGEVEKRVLEAWPVASYAASMEGELLPKYSLEGRLQRQLTLSNQGLRLPDAMQFFEEITRHRLILGQLPTDVPYGGDELDALALANTAYLCTAQPEEVELLGDVDEGQVAVPRPRMSDS